MAKKIVLKFALITFFIFVLQNPVYTQNPPSGQDVGAQTERLEKELQEKKEGLSEKKVKASEIEIEQKEEKPSAAEITFLLKEIKISGSTVFTQEDFLPIYQPYLNKKVSFLDLDAICEKIKAKYKEKGYLTTTVYLPEQDILGGIVEIRIVEGKMGKLWIEGNRWFGSGLIEKYFHTKKNEILNIKTVQRDLLRLNKNPDLEVRAIISKGTTEGTSDIVLKVKDKFPWHVSASEDTQGTRLTGKWRSAFILRSSNASGQADYLFIHSLYTNNSFGQSLSYTLPLGTYGTKFGLDATYFKMRLGKEYKIYDIIGRTHLYTPYISWELALSEFFSAYLSAGMDIKCIKKRTDGEITSNDQLRIPFFGFDFSENDVYGSTSFSPRFNFSTEHFWGASDRGHPTASRAGTGGFFFKYEQGLNRIQRLAKNTYLEFRSQFQAASHTLPSSEQIQIGGMHSVRGYPEGDYLADKGWSVNLEWLRPFNLSNNLRIEPVIFTDLGGGKLKKVLPGEKKDKFLVGVGGGFRLRFANYLAVKLYWAKGVGDRPQSGVGPSTFYFTFQSEI